MNRIVQVLLLLLAAPLSAQEHVVGVRVVDAAGERVAGATLRLRWREAPELPGLCGSSLGDAGVVAMIATADARGAFTIPLPHRGPFEVFAELAGQRSTPRFPVMAGAFVELRLQPPVVVGGVVTDAEGDPVANTKVTLVPELTAWSKLAAYRLPEWRGSTVTDAAGRFELPFHDAYLRTARWEPFSVLDFDVPGLAAKNLELLRPTQHCRELALQLVPVAKAHPRAPRASQGPGVLPGPPSGPTVRATLRWFQQPLADAAVLWSQLEANGPPTERMARTDAAGVVELANARSARRLLGFVECHGTWLPFARLDVRLEAVDLGVVEVVARPVVGRVLDAAGTPLPGARVAVMSAEPMADELPYVTYADHGGRFQFAALPPASLRIWAEGGRHGFASGEITAKAHEVELRTAAEGVITGAVADADGKPIAGAWLVLVRQGAGSELMPGLRPGSTHLCAHSDDAGRVQVRGLPAGKWQVIGNLVRDGQWFGGSAEVTTGGDFSLVLRVLPE